MNVWAVPIIQNVFPLIKMPKLSEVSWRRQGRMKNIMAELKALQEKAGGVSQPFVPKKSAGGYCI